MVIRSLSTDDVTAKLQVAHDLADHFARGTNHARHVLLGNLSAAPRACRSLPRTCRAAGGPRGHRHRAKRQALDIAIGLAQTTHQNLHQLLGNLEVLLHAALEIRSCRWPAFAGSTATTLAERGLPSIRPISPKNSPGPSQARMISLPFLVEIGHLGATSEQDVSVTRHLSPARTTCSLRPARLTHATLRQALEFALIETRKERHVAQEPPDSADICRGHKSFSFMELRGDYKLNSQISRGTGKKQRAVGGYNFTIDHPPRITMSQAPPQPPHHSRLRPRRLHRRRLCRPRQPQAGADHRHGPGRPADDHDRSRQLAGRCRRRAGSGPDGAFSKPMPALRHRNRVSTTSTPRS
jgi:hypothetical protein